MFLPKREANTAVRCLKSIGVVAMIAFAASAFLNSSSAFAVDFSGKKITALVPFKEGGGMDNFTRLFAPYFSKYLPGQPTILVRNMPGGGSIRANNWFQSNAKPDGSIYLGVAISNQTNFVMGGDKVKYDMRQWEYILNSPQGWVVLARPETGVKGKNIHDDITALRNIQVIEGTKTPASSGLTDFLAFELLGIKNVKPVFGLSTGGRRKATLRGELNVNHETGLVYQKRITKYVKAGKLVPLMTLGFTDKSGNIVRDPSYPDIPTIVDAYKAVNGGKMPSGILWEAYKNLYTMAAMATNGFALPPKTPKAILDVYVGAAKKIMTDKDFLKTAGKTFGNYPVYFGEDARKNYMAAIDISPEVKTFLKDFISKKYGTNI